MLKSLVKRTRMYIMKPKDFEMSGCWKCGNRNPDWSEYQGYLWCQDCEIDFYPKSGGILDEPIGIEACEALGIYFDQIEIATGEIIHGSNGIKHYDKR